MQEQELLTEDEILKQVGITREELHWYREQFPNQMRCLKVGRWYHPDAVNFLRGLSTMVSRGATPEMIKNWFGME